LHEGDKDEPIPEAMEGGGDETPPSTIEREINAPHVPQAERSLTHAEPSAKRSTRDLLLVATGSILGIGAGIVMFLRFSRRK
jgi:hypothetical protein